MKNKTRQVLATAIVTSLLSILIGGFAVWGSYRAEISIIDKHMMVVRDDVNSNPSGAITSALLSLDQNSFDFTLAFKTRDGSVTVLKESQNAILGSKTHLRTTEISIQEGEALVIAASLTDIDKNLTKNLYRLLIFIIFANALASYIAISISRAGALELERTQREKMQEFLGDAAHELRTPLTVVKGYTELLEGKALDGQHQELAFSRLKNEIKRMDFLIGDLLMLAQLGEEGNIEFESIDIAQLVRENVSDFKEIAPTHPVTTQIDQSAVLIGSQKYLQRFIQNALTNIRLHTPASTSVRVSVKADKQITLIIEDSGPGLPPESYGEKIRGLKRFDRSRSRDTGGTGLGMSIMNAVIERHKGTFTLRKSELGGLAIEVHLPRT